MSRRRQAAMSLDQTGFSLVELLVVISVVAILFITFGVVFNNNLILYSEYQQDSLNMTELSSQSVRISNVLRGLTDIISDSSNSLSAYAYFSPTDTYVSVVNYYLSGTTLKADVTPMTANPPNGTLITASKKTYTVISRFYQPTGVSLFTYYDASGTVLTPPVASEHTITEIGVNLAVPNSHTKNGQQLNVVVSLRNRKTNL